MSTKLHRELIDYAQDVGLTILQVRQKKHVILLVQLPSGERRSLAIPSGGNNCAINNWKSYARRMAAGQIPVGGRR